MQLLPQQFVSPRSSTSPVSFQRRSGWASMARSSLALCTAPGPRLMEVRNALTEVHGGGRSL